MGPAGRHDTGRGLAWDAAAAAAPQVSAEGDSLTAVRTPSTAKTAWFPFRQEIGWEEAATSAAVTWTDAECSVRGVKGLLLVYSHAHDYDHGPLGSFAKRHSITTQRSYRQHPGSGIVLVDGPELTLMDTAARGGSLGVVCDRAARLPVARLGHGNRSRKLAHRRGDARHSERGAKETPRTSCDRWQ